MNQHTQTIRTPAVAESPILAIGKARKLTQASFTGNRSELSEQRLYSLGG